MPAEHASSQRIAWVGPAPTTEGGVSGLATLLLRALPAAGVAVECYTMGEEEHLPDALREVPGLTMHALDTGWRYDRWYSSTAMTKLLTGQAMRALTQSRLIREIVRRHAGAPYDAYYQFSQPELLSARHARDALPPIIVHPETHAAGELTWHVRERGLARAAGEPAARVAGTLALFASRAPRQRKDLALVDRIVAPSQVFADHLARDYRLPPTRLAVVPNAVDLERFAPATRERRADGPLQILMVGRVSARKGIDTLVRVSHRLADLAGAVEITVVGHESLWSDYRPLLAHAQPQIVRYAGGMRSHLLPQRLGEADYLLQPSRYEPFAITVAEALASGTPAIVSDQVGAREGVDPRCCQVFPAGDVDALEASIRRAVEAGPVSPEVRALARSEAERLFSPARVAEMLAEVIAETSGSRRRPPRDASR